MNLVECYIIEVRGIRETEYELLEIDLTYNCYGNIKRTKHLATAKQWEVEKEQGYYMG